MDETLIPFWYFNEINISETLRYVVLALHTKHTV